MRHKLSFVTVLQPPSPTTRMLENQEQVPHVLGQSFTYWHRGITIISLSATHELSELWELETVT